jgi:diguanylate cyclase (GGDEF)-like protein
MHLVQTTLDIVLLTAGILIGSVAAGWLTLRWTQAINATEAERERHVLRRVVDRLQALTVQMANDIGEHSANMSSINDDIEAIDDGDVGEVVERVAQILAANENLQQRLAQAETRLQEQAAQIEHHATEARTDSLTGLPNRRAFDVEIERRIAEYHRKGTVLCVAIVDVDRFKRLNDEHGHLAGDEALRQLAEKLATALRDMDLVARYGGEEFGVVTPATEMKHVKMVAERCRSLISQSSIKVGELTDSLTVSIGIAEVRHGDDSRSLIQRADEAVYAAKRAGRNRVYWHDGELPRSVCESATLPENNESEQAEAVPKTTLVQETTVDVKPSPPAVASSSNNHAEDEEASHPEKVKCDEGDSGVLAENAVELTRECDRTTFCWHVRKRIADANQGEESFALLFAYLSVKSEAKTKAYSLAALRHLEGVLREDDIVARYASNLYAVLLPQTPLVEAVSITRRFQVQLLDTFSALERVSLEYGLGLTESLACDEWMEIVRRSEDAVRESQRLGGAITCFTTSGLRSLSPHEATASHDDECALVSADH